MNNDLSPIERGIIAFLAEEDGPCAYGTVRGSAYDGLMAKGLAIIPKGYPFCTGLEGVSLTRAGLDVYRSITAEEKVS